jgi:hypothetical protein
MLTKEQQKHITKTLDGVAKAIRQEQENDKEKWMRRVGDDSRDSPETLDRIEYIGRQAAYEKCFHLAKTATEVSYEAEYQGADEKIEMICKNLDAQADVFNSMATQTIFESGSEVFRDNLKDQAELTKKFARDIRLILHLCKK